MCQLYWYCNFSVYGKRFPDDDDDDDDDDVNTSKHVGVYYDTDFIVNILCISSS